MSDETAPDRGRRLFDQLAAAWRRARPRVALLAWTAARLIHFAVFAAWHVVEASWRLWLPAAALAAAALGGLAQAWAAGATTGWIFLGLAVALASQAALGPAWQSLANRLEWLAATQPAARAMHVRGGAGRWAWAATAALGLVAFAGLAARLEADARLAALALATPWIALAAGRMVLVAVAVERRLRAAYYLPGLPERADAAESRLVGRLPGLAPARAWRLAVGGVARVLFGGLVSALARPPGECAG